MISQPRKRYACAIYDDGMLLYLTPPSAKFALTSDTSKARRWYMRHQAYDAGMEAFPQHSIHVLQLTLNADGKTFRQHYVSV